ncbi:NAD(P)-binding protein [Pseudoalteromonas sp. PPB1]|uniref:NAD(P)-binding protein n=1 Tax=Pseudoalteromonas sp. PPB1 TaxID=2756136 RepID=UPI002264D670|nr:NAD(P)-binding protein [Pseudoalteromonas sp. PPB1]
MTSQTHDKVVIVGGGPAGTAAAAELARHGLKSVIIDEAPKLGGVIYRGPLRKTIHCRTWMTT